MILKKLLKTWRNTPAGATIVVPREVHADLVDKSIVAPTSAVRELIAEWEDPSGTTLPAGSRVELDAATRDELSRIGVLGPTATHIKP